MAANCSAPSGPARTAAARSGWPGIEQRDGQDRRGSGGDDGLVGFVGELQALLRGGDGGLEVAGGNGDEGAAEERPGQSRRVAGQARGLDGGVEQLRRVGKTTDHAQGHAERRVDPGEQLALPGGPPDRERALGVRGGLDEAVEVDLRAGEIHGGVQAAGELLVGQRVEDRGRLGAHLLASARLAAPGQRASERGQRGGLERRIADGLGGVDGLLGPRLAGFVPQAVDLVGGEFEHQRRPRRAGGVRQVVQRGGEPLMSLRRGGRAGARRARRRRPAGRAARSHRRRRARGFRASASCASAKRPVAASAVATAESSSTRCSAARGLRQQAQRAGEPARRRRRRALGGLPAGLGERGHGGRVADLGGGVDVLGASQGAGATVSEGLGDPLVGTDAPGGRRGLIDGAPDDRMAEAEAPGHAGRPDQVGAEQLVDGLHRLRLADVGRGGGQLGLERVAGDRRALQHPPAAGRQQRELLAQGGHDHRRHLQLGDRHARTRARPAPRRRTRAPAAPGRTGCRPTPRTAARLRRLRAHGRAWRRPPRRSAGRARCASAGRLAAPARWRCAAAATRGWAGRPARSARRRPAGRCSRLAARSTDAGSAQWKSSRMSTSGLVAASRSSSSRTARLVR